MYTKFSVTFSNVALASNLLLSLDFSHNFSICGRGHVLLCFGLVVVSGSRKEYVSACSFQNVHQVLRC